MRRIYCDICTHEITGEDVYGLKLYATDSHGQDMHPIRIEICQPCHRDALATLKHWRENGIVTKYT